MNADAAPRAAAPGAEGPAQRPAVLFATLAEQVRVRPDAPCLSCGGEDLSYRGLEARIDAQCAALRAQGLGPGITLGWLGLNSIEQIAALFACARLGARFVPLNWRLSAPELQRIALHAGIALLHAEPGLSATAPRELAPLAPSPGHEEGDLLLVYTSGTTGEPKAAVHTQAAMVANLQAAIEAQGLDEHTRTLALLPLFHVGGLCIQTLPTLAAGGCVRLHSRFDADACFDDLEAWRPSTCLLVPAVMRALVDHPRWPDADLSSLAFVTSGSQIVPQPFIEAFHERGVPVAQVYGATETGPVSIVLPPHEAMSPPGRPKGESLSAQHEGTPVCPPGRPKGESRSAQHEGTPVSPPGRPKGESLSAQHEGKPVSHAGRAGRPALGVQVRLAHDGEVLLRAPNLMRGYHGEAASAFDEDGWFHTGDLARLHTGGLYEITGRSKEVIISGGENIHPAEIESLIAARPEVAECAVVGLPDERWGEVPVLAIVARPGRQVDAGEVLASLAGKLARFKHPHHVVLVEALPKTALGKVIRAELRALLERG